MSRKKFTTVLTEAHDAALALAVERQQELAEARAAAPLAADALTAAKKARADLDTRLASGDASVTAEALTLADAEVTRATALADAARKRAERLKRQATAADTDLAELIAPAAGDVLPGVPVLTSVALPDAEPAPADLPVAVVVQGKPTERDGSGLLAGAVEVVLYGSIVHRSLNADELARALDERGIVSSVVQVGGTAASGQKTDRDAVLASRLRVNVAGAEPAGLPVVPQVREHQAQGIGNGLATKWVRAGLGRGSSTPRWSQGWLEADHFTATADTRVLSNEVREDGTRTVVTRVLLNGRATGYQYGYGSTDSSRSFDMRAAAEDLVGRLVPHVGRVVSVEPSPTQSAQYSYRIALESLAA